MRSGQSSSLVRLLPTSGATEPPGPASALGLIDRTPTPRAPLGPLDDPPGPRRCPALLLRLLFRHVTKVPLAPGPGADGHPVIAGAIGADGSVVVEVVVLGTGGV